MTLFPPRIAPPKLEDRFPVSRLIPSLDKDGEEGETKFPCPSSSSQLLVLFLQTKREDTEKGRPLSGEPPHKCPHPYRFLPSFQVGPRAEAQVNA